MIAALLLSAAVGSTPPSLDLQTLDGRRVVERHPIVLMFWRTDCGPCRLELGDLQAFRRAAAPLPIQLVGLQTAAAVRQDLRAASLPADSVWTAQDAGKVLLAWGGPPPRLPLAVALDSHGRVCGRRTGLLGTDQLAAWSKACGGRHALH